jgi:malate dehydrogenase
MRTVAIVGAGDLGASICWRLACADSVGRILLIDRAAELAAGKALDIQQSGPVERFDTHVAGTSDADAGLDAAAIVIADEADGGEWSGDLALQTVARWAQARRPPVIVCAGAGQRTLIAAAVDELGYSRTRIFGSAPLAAVAAARAYAALELDAAAPQVALTLAGAPPGWAIAWSGATLGGAAIEPRLTPPAIARIERRLAASWPPGPHTLAAAASAVVNALLSRSRLRFECYVARRTAGREVAVAMPVSLDPAGIAAVHEPELTTRERIALDAVLAG